MTDTVLERWFTPGFRASDPDIVDGVRAQLLHTPPEGYAACCGVVGSMDLRPDLEMIGVPTLVISAADDPSTPPAHVVKRDYCYRHGTAIYPTLGCQVCGQRPGRAGP